MIYRKNIFLTSNSRIRARSSIHGKTEVVITLAGCVGLFEWPVTLFKYNHTYMDTLIATFMRAFFMVIAWIILTAWLYLYGTSVNIGRKYCYQDTVREKKIGSFLGQTHDSKSFKLRLINIYLDCYFIDKLYYRIVIHELITLLKMDIFFCLIFWILRNPIK